MWHILCVPPSPRALHGSQGPSPGCDFGEAPPLLDKGHLQDHVLPAPFWRGSVQKNHPRVWESSPKAQPNKPLECRGGHRQVHSQTPVWTPPQGQAGTPRAVPFLVEHPRAHEMVAKQILSSRIHMSRSLLMGGTGQPNAGTYPSTQCPHPATKITSTDATSAGSFCPKGSWPSPCPPSIPLPTSVSTRR